MTATGGDRFSMTNEQYLAKYNVVSYLEDSVEQLLEHREDNPRVVPARYLSDYFRSVVQSNHTLFREYKYIKSTPWNRSCFIRVFWKAFKSIGKNGDLLSASEYHSLICLLCHDFPFTSVQKAAKIVLMEDAMDCLMSFADFLYAFQIQFCFEEFIDKLQEVYHEILTGNYRPGQVVVVPTTRSSQPKHSQQINPPPDHNIPLNSSDGVEVHVFLDAISQIMHTHTHVFRCPPLAAIKNMLSSVQRVTFYGFLMALAKHEEVNESIGSLPQKTSLMEDTDQDITSASSRPKSARSKNSHMSGNTKKSFHM